MDRGIVLSAPVIKDERPRVLYGTLVGYLVFTFNRHGMIYCGHVHRSLKRAESCRRRLAVGECNHSEIRALWENSDDETLVPFWQEVVSPEDILMFS